ncbi:MAG: Crp/Fnr family transcriptional regulator [Gammaproteobacteria bacterium]|nr:Crp/Fnr family transcriptional regulator [Gammaproteobacteria bacterium]
MSTLHGRPPLELGLIGRDGMLGATLSLGVLVAPMQAVVQEAGSALVIKVPELRAELHDSPRLLEALHRYQFRLMMQLLQTAACTHFHEIEPRLARWLLMTQDLGITDSVHFTHEFLSHTLGVRRSGVTVAAGSLQRRGFISYSRGHIRILDRPGLESAACECHQALNDKYRLVFG